MKRMSFVDAIYFTTITITSTLQIGDSVEILPITRALAVQKVFPTYNTKVPLPKYRIFSEDIPQPVINEPVQTTFINENPVTRVKSISGQSVSTSSLLHVGNTSVIRAESRIKHIREVLEE
ncbi:spore germination protein GerPE [Bacillus sp. HMF5848]|uniref:spore germination protein GerPE n=1 Tax=Bacillus sp. HMF5848 TaxID=2495421 RepID=UPI000F79CB8B|nr:spore germination protein GerPE [Bacillus sp. HMF5848]RSK26361.1 spore germination protein GerPE [Bacillus sp. HMF5848]